MATASAIIRGASLENGDRMSRDEFHRLYDAAPEGFRAELIGGIVYVSSPASCSHGPEHLRLVNGLDAYQVATPGVEAGENVSLLLADDAEPQPDLCVRMLPDHGGQSQTSDDHYIVGAPELIIEIAHSSRAIDLHAKRDSYMRHGVDEYLVVCLAERELHWFDLPRNEELPTDSDGVVRMRTFPGLWIDGKALFAGDLAKLLATAQAGIATPEHAAFAAKLAAARTSRGG